MDVLSEVLKAVKLDGAVFFNGEFSTPWCAMSARRSVRLEVLKTASSSPVLSCRNEGRLS